MPFRVKPLEGVLNFRDFGGYETTDGGKVRTNLLFRTGHLNGATAADVDYLNGLGINFQVDLRRPSERTRLPQSWRPHEIHEHPSEGSHPTTTRFIEEADEFSVDVAHRFMVAFYENAPFAENLVDNYRRWFDRLSHTDGAALINCAAGKDRTGIGCALTLHLLDVPMDQIIEDYQRTNTASNIHARLPAVRVWMEGELGRPLSDEALLRFVGVDAEYLNAAFAVMEDKHGSVRNYMSEVLGVTDDHVSKLKERLVE